MKKYDKSFNIEADTYDEIRPGYPNDVYIDMNTQVQFKSDEKVLEIGSGNGIATEKLANFDLDILALEPGENLIKISEQRLKDYPKVKHLCNTFESAKLKESSFDYLIAATSFHWLKGEGEFKKFRRSYNLLNDKGKLIVFWNSFSIEEDNLVEEVDLVYDDIFSGGKGAFKKEKDHKDSRDTGLAKIIKREQELSNNDYFFISYLNRYLVRYVYNSEQYLKLLNTYPEVIDLEENQKQEFLNRIKKIIENNNNTLTLRVVTNLYILTKKENFHK